jgi:hypothetical protein
VVTGLGFIAALIYYLNTYIEEQGCIEKFEEEYKH